jgi:hypothetical protein
VLRSLLQAAEGAGAHAQPGPVIDTAWQDEALACAYPGLRMQWQDPAPARHAHDKLAVDAWNYYSKGSLAVELIGGKVADDCDHFRYCQALGDVGDELDLYYKRSPTFRRLFNYWQGNLRNGQRLLLRARESDGALMGVADLADHAAGILAAGPRGCYDGMDEIYPSDRGPLALTWSLRLLYAMLRVLCGQPLGDRDGHVRGAVIEYANIVSQEARGGNAPHLHCCTAPPAYVPLAQARRADEPLISSSAMAVARLDRHLALTQRYLDRHQPSDKQLAGGDLEVIHDVIQAENIRLPDLRLTLHESVEGVAHLLRDLPAPFHRRVIFGDRKKSLHYVYADIQGHADHTLSILLIEPSTVDNVLSLALYRMFAERMRRLPGHSEVRIGVVSTDVQHTSADSLMLCMAFAQAAHRHCASILNLHPRRCGRNVLSRSYSYGYGYGTYASPALLRQDISSISSHYLPADFIKHAYSEQVLRRHRDERPEDRAGAAMLTRRMALVRSVPKVGSPYLPSAQFKRRSLVVGAVLAFMPHTDEA